MYKKIILLSVISTSCIYASENDEIERMAAIYIPVALVACELQETDEKKKDVAYALARNVFSYWYAHTYGNGRKSEKINTMIVAMHLDSIDKNVKINKILTEALNDPLRLRETKDVSSLIGSWKFSSYKSYLKERDLFNSHIKDLLSKRNGN